MSAGDETKVANCKMTAGKNCMNDGTPKYAIARSGLDQNWRLRPTCTTFRIFDTQNKVWVTNKTGQNPARPLTRFALSISVPTFQNGKHRLFSYYGITNDGNLDEYVFPMFQWQNIQPVLFAMQAIP